MALGCSEAFTPSDERTDQGASSGEDPEVAEVPTNVTGSYLNAIVCSEAKSDDSSKKQIGCYVVDKGSEARVTPKSIASEWKWGIRQTNGHQVDIQETSTPPYDVIYTFDTEGFENLSDSAVTFQYKSIDTGENFFAEQSLKELFKELSGSRQVKLDLLSLGEFSASGNQTRIDSIDILINGTWKQLCVKLKSSQIAEKIPEDQRGMIVEKALAKDFEFFFKYMDHTDMGFFLGNDTEDLDVTFPTSSEASLSFLGYLSGISKTFDIAETPFDAKPPHDIKPGQSFSIQFDFKEQIHVGGIAFRCTPDGELVETCQIGSLPDAFPDHVKIFYRSFTSNSWAKPKNNELSQQAGSSEWRHLWTSEVPADDYSKRENCQFKIE